MKRDTGNSGDRRPIQLRMTKGENRMRKNELETVSIDNSFKEFSYKKTQENGGEAGGRCEVGKDVNFEDGRTGANL